MSTDCDGRLTAAGVTHAYDGAPVLRDVSFAVGRGEMVALAGPNGSGKTTLLNLLSGALRPRGGNVCLDGRPMDRISPRTLATRLAVVAQHTEARLAFTVEHLVSMGRAPYVGLWRSPNGDDRRAVREALRATDMEGMGERRFDELSGGEQQRAMLAVALAQETDYLLLDEPTVHLDLHHQHQLLELLARLHRERGVSILAVMHDLNLAALYCPRLTVLSEGHLVADGPAADVLTAVEVQQVFRAPLSTVIHPVADVPQVLLNPNVSPVGPSREAGRVE